MAYPADLKYTKDHEWIRVNGDTAEIGITDYAQQQLGDVVYLDLPEVGKSITAGESFGSIESVKAVSELFAPMSGEVIAVNDDLKNHPEAVNGQPHQSWMIRVKLAAGADNAELMDAASYERTLG